MDTILDYRFDSENESDKSENESDNAVIIDKNTQETISLVRYQNITVSLTPYRKRTVLKINLEINLVEQPYLNIN